MVSVRRRVAPVLLFAVALPLFGAAKKGVSHPPADLHKVGDHWTAYNPPDPSTYPAGAKTYVIKKGDTLWALGQQFLGNAYLWPQIWESNTWITDAHWIYPGDTLLIEGEAAKQVAATEAGTTAPQQTAEAATTTPTPSPAPARQTPAGGEIGGGGTEMTNAAEPLGGTAGPVPLGTESDVYCYGYIGDPNEPMPNSVAALEDYDVTYLPGEIEQSLGAATGNLVLITGGTSTGLVAGETYLVIKSADIVTNPITKAQVGRRYEYRGQIRVLCADADHARGIITQSCMDIHRGDRLKPLPQIPIPLARIPNIPAFCDPPSGKRPGTIVDAQGGWDLALGEGLLVQIDLGRDDQIQPGDFLTVYRENTQPGQARQVLGEIGILTTEPHTAMAKIVAMRYSMKVGDRVEVR